MAQQRGYKIRHYVNGSTKAGKEYKNYSLTVPNHIAEALPNNLTFEAVMTDEGLLYKPTTNVQNTAIELPSWAQSDSSTAT
jgi:hypothetical protein